MPAKNSTLVRLPNPLVDRLDAARGDVARAAFLDALLSAYEQGEIVAGPESKAERRTRSQIAKRGREMGRAPARVEEEHQGLAGRVTDGVLDDGDPGKRDVSPNFKKAK